MSCRQEGHPANGNKQKCPIIRCRLTSGSVNDDDDDDDDDDDRRADGRLKINQDIFEAPWGLY